MEAPGKTRGQNSSNATKKGQKSTNPRGKYAWRACQECRRRRAKCDGAKPSCSRCTNQNSTCVYDTGDDHRGTAPKSLVRLLQARISILEKILQMHSIDIDEAAAKLMPNGVLPARAATGTQSVFDQLCNEFQGALCFDESVNFDQDGQPRYFGRTSGRLEFETSDATETEQIPPMNTGRCFDLYVQSIHAEPAISEELTSELIDLYFKWENPWCQIVDERLFRESNGTKGPYCSMLLFKCVLAIGSRYCDAPELRTDPNDPNTAGKKFLETAEILLHFDLKWPSITTIQSLTLLATYYVAIGSDAAGWLHHGMAIQLALDRGLNLDPSTLAGSTRIPCEEVALRRKIYWVLYCNDKLWASYTGRVCNLLSTQAAVDPPPPARVMEESDSPLDSVKYTDVASLHHALSTHCQILEEILVNFYSPKRMPQVTQAKSFFESCLVALQSWYYNLPTELKVEGGTDKVNTIPHAYTLCMVYHTSTILLTRPFVPKTDGTTPGSSTSQPDALQEDILLKSKHLCVEAAKEISMIGEKYRKTFGSFRKSPITATHCTLTAALVLLNAECLNGCGENGVDMSYINSCIKTFEELSDSWTPPRRYWCSIKRLVNLRRLPGHDCEDCEHHPKPTGQVVGDTGTASAMLQENTSTFQQALGNTMLHDDFVFDEPFWQGFMPDLAMDLQQDILEVNTLDFRQ